MINPQDKEAVVNHACIRTLPSYYIETKSSYSLKLNPHLDNVMSSLRFLIVLPAVVLRVVRAYSIELNRTISFLDDIPLNAEADSSIPSSSTIVGSFVYKQWAFVALGVSTLCLMIVLVAVS
nr:hypothetical transcript [Hymenolepis microstoma]